LSSFEETAAAAQAPLAPCTPPIVRPLVTWHVPGGAGGFYWKSHDRCWRNVFGRATGTGNPSDNGHFSWSGNANPNESNVGVAAKRIWDYCHEIRYVKKTHPALRRVRLVGHSAGALVCSRATHLKPADFEIEQVILLSPPVHDPTHPPTDRFPNFQWLYPNLTNIQGGRFFNFHPDCDKVLQGIFDCWQDHQNHPEISTFPDSNISACPAAEILRPIPITKMPNGHWAPCDPDVWEPTASALWAEVGC
jgi:pimeloyl-ACP methyl ester carboxylesterase